MHTGIWKQPVDGPRMVRRLNIDGDGQGDLNGHGGEQRAVFVYQIESYRHWQEHLGRDDFEFGQFGENFTVEGLGDDEVCIGDRYRIGEAEFEVTQPRVTCFRVGMRLGEPRMPALLVAHHRPGLLPARDHRRRRYGPATRSCVPGSAGTRSASPTSTRCCTCPTATSSGSAPPSTSRRSARAGSSRSASCSTPTAEERRGGRRRRSASSRAGPGSAGCGSPSSCRRPRR